MYTTRSIVVAALAAFAGTAAAQNGLFISVADNLGTEINGGPYTDNDVILTDTAGTTSSLFFSIDGGDLDAFHILPSGNYLVSSLFNGDIGGTTFDDADLIEYNPNTGTIVGNYLGIGLSSFTSAAPDISAATTDNEGNLYFSMLGTSNTMNHAGGSITFTDGDIIRVDADTGVASLFLAEAAIFDDGDGDVYGLHWMDDNTFLISANTDETISGNFFEDGSVFLYDITGDNSGPFFLEDSFTDGVNTHDIDAVYYNIPAPASLALLGVSGLVAGRRRR